MKITMLTIIGFVLGCVLTLSLFHQNKFGTSILEWKSNSCLYLTTFVDDGDSEDGTWKHYISNPIICTKH